MTKFALCPVPPDGYGNDKWKEDRQPLVDAFSKRHETTEEAVKEADEYLWKHVDIADLRALGYCRHCGQQITLRQAGRCVYSSCGHYRAQGDHPTMQAHMDQRRASMSPARREALLGMIGTALMDVAIEKDHHVRR